MKYVQPYGVSDASASYVDGNPALGVEGSAVPAKAIEHPMRELVYLITKAGLTPDEAKLTQVYEAIQKIIQDAMPEKQEIYELYEFYHFRQPVLRPGFQPAQGGLLANAATQYPEAWAYLKTAEGQRLCKTESEWQALTTAIFATLADGSQVGWDGIGGAPFYVQDTANGTLRLPDLRGMYAEAAGYDSLDVGGTHLDAMRNLHGYFSFALHTSNSPQRSGIFSTTPSTPIGYTGATYYGHTVQCNAADTVPVASKNQPRAWGALPCVYLGAPK